jgi:hypothetical protein
MISKKTVESRLYTCNPARHEMYESLARRYLEAVAAFSDFFAEKQ